MMHTKSLARGGGRSPLLAAFTRGLRVVAEPPLPSPLAAGDRTGAITAEPDEFSSRKLQGKQGQFRRRDVVPMWIADMDYRCPQPVIDAVVACAQRGLFGYTNPPPALTPLTLQRLASVYGCSSAKPEWIGWLSGLVPGLSHAVRVAMRRAPQGSEVGIAVLTPAYPPFLSMPGFNGAALEAVPLLETRVNCDLSGALDDEATSSVVRFEIDWSALDACLAKPSTSLLLLCNPHNPTGRCWPRQDLMRLASLCVQHDVLVCSDEVWGEMPLQPDTAPFTSALALVEDVSGLAERLLVLTSPSKCFNVATLDIALTVVPDATLRAEFAAAGRDAAEVTPFGYFATEACYGDPESEAWRQRLVTYLRANRDYAVQRLTTALAGRVLVTVPEASYLLWVDTLGKLDERELNPEAGSGAVSAATHLLSHGVGVSAGEDFGASPSTFRINLACSREVLERGLSRIIGALD